MTPLLLAAPLLSTALQAGQFLEWMRKADSRSEPGERIEYYSRALKAWTPQDGQALLAHCHFRRGEAFFGSGQLPQALPDLDKALHLDSRNARAYLLRGRIHLAGKRLQKASSDLQEYASLAPEDIEGLLLLAQVQGLRGKGSEALALYRKASVLEPADFRPALGEGRIYLALEQWFQAKDCLDRADALARHRDGGTLSLRAAARAALGEDRQALADYADGLPLLEARLLHLKRSAADAEEIRRQAEQIAGAYYQRGRLHEKLGRDDLARSDYEQACRMGRTEGCSKALAPKKRKAPKPDNDPGRRIYAN